MDHALTHHKQHGAGFIRTEVTISHRTTPSEYTSTAGVRPSPMSISGAAQAKVPIAQSSDCRLSRAPSVIIFAMPTSASLA